jgi:redox-sensitive bicupin YhaK (pirin superfamily)
MTILQTLQLAGPPWPTPDPFLFCVHHDDAYPAGESHLGPKSELLAGRQIGMDFAGKDGWRMYHGEIVPGFPAHPHRGFETVTIVRRGFIDHSDSLGATARFGQGDVQWLTAGSGIVHCEMFPLLQSERDNPLELFQIWLNLPKKSKLVDPHFSMLWHEAIPRRTVRDDAGRASEIVIVAGHLGDTQAPPPPPSSWASAPENDVAIWTLRLAPHARVSLPKPRNQGIRTLYFFRGPSVRVAGEPFTKPAAVVLDPEKDVELEAGDGEVELLMLQGRPIGEPVAQHGPFVMNTAAEIQQAMLDYQRTRFGGWPWPNEAPVHPRERGRFAKHADGRVEER